jgi:hypothetical protein
VAVGALQVVNTPVTLKYPLSRKPCLLEVPVDVRSHHEQVFLAGLLPHGLCEVADDLKPPVRLFLTIHGEPRAIEAPEEVGMLDEKVGIRAIVEVEFIAIGRVVLPKTAVAAKIRKA